MAQTQSIQVGDSSNFAMMWDDDDSSVFYNQEFDSLEFPQLQLKNPPLHEYVIYKNKTEFEVVQANTALEALEQLKIQAPFKILHSGRRLASIISSSKLKKAELEEELTAEESTEAPVEQKAATAAPAVEEKTEGTTTAKAAPQPQAVTSESA